MKMYEKVELSDLARSDAEYVKVTGVARAPSQTNVLKGDNVRTGPYASYQAVLQDLSDPNNFVPIYGDVKNQNGITRVLMLLTTSSETEIPVEVWGRNFKGGTDPCLSEIEKITLGNLTYTLPGSQFY